MRKFTSKESDFNPSEYIGYEGEITVDEDTLTLKLHNGSTPGGVAISGGGSSDRLVNGSKSLVLGADGTLTPPAQTSNSRTGYGFVLKLGDPANQNIIMGATANVSNPTAQRLVIAGADGFDTGEGGDIYLWAGKSGNNGGSGGDIKVDAGDGLNGSEGGTIKIRAGGAQSGTYNQNGGFIEVTAGSAWNTANGGDLSLSAGNAYNGGTDGKVYVYTRNGQWKFNPDGTLTLPYITKLNSGGIGVTNSAEFGTDVQMSGYSVVTSEIYMGCGTGEARVITDSNGHSLTYIGVEDTGAPAFAGTVSLDPNVDSMYSIAVGAGNCITIGATQPSGHLATTEYTAGLGVLNADYNINGIIATPSNVTIGVGTVGWVFGTNSKLTFPDHTVQTTAWTGVSITPWSASVETNLHDIATTDDIVLINHNGQTPVLVFLPSSGIAVGKKFTIKKTTGDNKMLSVQVTGNGYIDGTNTGIEITNNYGYLTVVWDGSQYWILDQLLT